MAGLLVGLTGIDMAGGTGAPLVGVIDLPGGAFLKKELPSPVENPEVNGTMGQVIHMDLAPKLGTGHTILGINHIAHLAGMIMPLRGDMEGEIGPVIHRQILGPGGERVPLGRGPLFPRPVGELEQ
jgi:hypothetical protein